MKSRRYTLQPGCWYAAELIGDDMPASDGGVVARSPIRVDALRPHQSGKRLFELAFYHAAYPEGVRDKQYRLQTIERGASFMLARSVEHRPVRLVLLHALSAQWLTERCRVRDLLRGVDLQAWCAAHC